MLDEMPNEMLDEMLGFSCSRAAMLGARAWPSTVYLLQSRSRENGNASPKLLNYSIL